MFTSSYKETTFYFQTKTQVTIKKYNNIVFLKTKRIR